MSAASIETALNAHSLAAFASLKCSIAVDAELADARETRDDNADDDDADDDHCNDHDLIIIIKTKKKSTLLKCDFLVTLQTLVGPALWLNELHGLLGKICLPLWRAFQRLLRVRLFTRRSVIRRPCAGFANVTAQDLRRFSSSSMNRFETFPRVTWFVCVVEVGPASSVRCARGGSSIYPVVERWWREPSLVVAARQRRRDALDDDDDVVDDDDVLRSALSSVAYRCDARR